MSERLGIVYTPVEVVDFIIQSVEVALQEEFGKSLADKGVHILDPFTGTGTFIARLLQSGILSPKELRGKYKTELHANEIVLLAYYIAAINIEETFHGLVGGDYEPFDGIVLTDTFQLTESALEEESGGPLPENSKRLSKQKGTDIQVVISNPPYSALQDSQNDNNQNLKYPVLDQRIRSTYVEKSSATNKNKSYDSYIRAIRWSSDRIRDQGVIGLVTNGSFIEKGAMDGLRKSLVGEFSKIYCFNLRGDARTQGEVRRKEGGNVFGAGTRTPVAITVFIKSKRQSGECELRYYDIGDYHTKEKKLETIRELGSIKQISWKTIVPNEDGDWVNQRDPEFDGFIPLGEKDGAEQTIFGIYSNGVLTARDPWIYNFSQDDLTGNMKRTINTYNSEIDRYKRACNSSEKAGTKPPQINDFIESDARQISWAEGLLREFSRERKHTFDATRIVRGSYRPFVKQRMYLDRQFNERVYLIPRLFPTPESKNIVICVTGVAERKGFSLLVADEVPNFHLMDTSSCFPLYWYEQSEDRSRYVRRDAITDWALNAFRSQYSSKTINKEDIFYYVYGILHSPQYRERYESSLKKMLPRIPMVRSLSDFKLFSQAGRTLSEFHLNYEKVEPYPVQETGIPVDPAPARLCRVEQMRFAKNGRDKDRTTIIYNSNIQLSSIPLDAYNYVLNGRSPIEWVMERYAVTVDNDSGIKNDPNKWSDDPRYILELLKRVVRVCVETNRIIRELPKLDVSLEQESKQTG